MAARIEGSRERPEVPAPAAPPPRAGGRRGRSLLLAGLILVLAGCSGEPSGRELRNRREVEALLTAISLRSRTELDKDARRIEARHASGELSDVPFRTLQEIIKQAQAGDWAAAEKQSYAFRENSPFFN